MKRNLLRFFQGMLIGVGSILPGVSGGMLCVLFGVYEPMMLLLSAPLMAIKLHWRMFLPLMFGASVGFFGLAGAAQWAFERAQAMSTCLFLGLIAGSLPPLWAEAGRTGRSSTDRRLCRASFLWMLTLMIAIRIASPAAIRPNAGWFFFCGAVWGLSLVLPGLSSSTVLIFLGLYQPMTSGIASLQPECILPLGAGILLTVLLSARRIEYLLAHHRAALHHFLFGTVCASAVMIVPTEYSGVLQSVACMVCAAFGFGVAVFLQMLNPDY